MTIILIYMLFAPSLASLFRWKRFLFLFFVLFFLLNCLRSAMWFYTRNEILVDGYSFFAIAFGFFWFECERVLSVSPITLWCCYSSNKYLLEISTSIQWNGFGETAPICFFFFIIIINFCSFFSCTNSLCMN